jgi:hypothetical protein
MAHAALARLVDVAPTAPEKHQVLLSYLTRYLKAEPARLAAADSIVAQIDKLGDAGLPERIVAHNTLLNFYGRKHYNSRLVRREAEQVIALERRMPEQEWNKLAPLGSAYIDLMLWAWLNYPDSMPMVAQQYQQDLRSPAVQSALRKICVDDRKASSTCTLASAPIDTVIQALLRPSNGFQIQQMAPPIRADFWFPAPGRGSVQPAPGVVSLIIKPVLINNCVDTPGACKELLSKLRRLMDRYGSSGLSITMLVDVPGYRMGGDPGPADSVAQSYRMYLQDYFKWPVTVAVRTKKIIYRLPSPDGRIFYGDTKYGDVYDSNVVVITDQSGKVIYTSSNVDLDANIGVVPPLELFVEHALAVSKQAAHSTPAAVPSAHR